jgi:hypothetical protein
MVKVMMTRVLTFTLFLGALLMVVHPIAVHRNLSCRIADAGNSNPMVVTTITWEGNSIEYAPVTMYQNHKVQVEYSKGDTFDPQSNIALKVDDIITRVYNVHEDGLFTQTGKDYFLQCYFLELEE